MKETKLFIILFLSLNIYLIAQDAVKNEFLSVIPLPARMETISGSFRITTGTRIIIDKTSSEMQALAELLSDRLSRLIGKRLSIQSKMDGAAQKESIILEIKPGIRTAESYTVNIRPESISITAADGAGMFYALQSLFQILPLESNGAAVTIQCASIEDYPRFKWRGAHLDVGRHLFPIDFIKKYIDILAMYKLNSFHWHLTEDQGWRIEIKKYPKLTEVGAWRKETMKDGKKYGGFYTQAEIKDVVAYARERYINIVPEIEMPGHSLAAVASYPELSCTGGPFEVGEEWGVFEDVFCAGEERVFQFLEAVLSEVMELFPGKYIHIGGDEVPKARWNKCIKCQARIKSEGLKDENQLQSYFIQRIEKFVNSKGRSIIGWDEILEGGLAPNAAVMSWRGVEGGIAAAKANHYAVMSPGAYCYFDHYQGLNNEPKAIGGFTPLEKVYSYEPVPESLNCEESKYIMGAQANVWTEYMESSDYVEYMLVPRICALSEVVWSQKNSRNYDNFSQRMIKNYEMLSAEKINFRIPLPVEEYGEWPVVKNQTIKMNRIIADSEIHYTLDGAEPGLFTSLYSEPFNLNESALLKAKTFLKNGRCSQTSVLNVSVIDSSLNGLSYKYFEGVWSAIPQLDSIPPLHSGKVKRFSLSDIQSRDEYFCVSWEGLIEIRKDGEYTFYLTSDDGSRLYINNNELIDNDGLHSAKEMSGKIHLTAGKVPLKIYYLQNSGSKIINLEYEGPERPRAIVPASMLFFN